jgi:hypothetical protein
MRYVLAVMLTMTLIGTGMAAPEGAPSADLGNNAALRYWTAFALMSAPTPEQDRIIGEWKTAPMDDKAAEIIEQNRKALDYLQLAAEVKPCDWGIVQTGPDTILIYLAKARQVTRLACLRARCRFSRGENVDGVRDVCAVLIMASQCDSGDSDTLVPLLVKCAIQNAALDAVSGHLAGLDVKALKMLNDYLDVSPQHPDFAAALRMERQYFLGGYIQPLRAGDLKVAQKLLDFLHGTQDLVPADWIPSGKATPQTAQQLSRQLEELDASYQRLIDAAGLPPSEFEERAKAEATKLNEMRNPFGTYSSLGGLDRVRYTSARADTLILMLRAAAAIVKDGPEKVKDFKDPYGAGPFEYRALPGGFELKSALVVKDNKPVTLTAGGR